MVSLKVDPEDYEIYKGRITHPIAEQNLRMLRNYSVSYLSVPGLVVQKLIIDRNYMMKYNEYKNMVSHLWLLFGASNISYERSKNDERFVVVYVSKEGALEAKKVFDSFALELEENLKAAKRKEFMFNGNQGNDTQEGC